jgi:hypothetical protein
MIPQHNRRSFLRSAAATGFWVAGTVVSRSNSPSERVRFGCIGVGGKGESDTADAAKYGAVVALCDVDDHTLAAAAAKYLRAKRYNDFRRMLDEMGKAIDAVTVSTPDHCHAVASAMAMRMGKHCFTQKPLARTLHEARRLGEIAREMKVATQMGNQGTASDNMRRWAAMVRAGVIGTVKEVHVWSDRPRSGPRASPGRPRRPCPRTCTGTYGWGRAPGGPTPAASTRTSTGRRASATRATPSSRCPTATTRSPGAAGGTSAPAAWATWPATS